MSLKKSFSFFVRFIFVSKFHSNFVVEELEFILKSKTQIVCKVKIYLETSIDWFAEDLPM